MTTPKLSLGPVLFYWPRDVLFDFYERVVDTPIDIIYLGETICSKRKSLHTQDWLDLADKLATTGKEVILSTLSLFESESELKTLRRLCKNGRFIIEANDMAAVHLLENTSFVTGHSINIYNNHTLAKLAKLGLKRWVLPVELSRETLIDLHTNRPTGVETEVFVYGRLPLAYSARCFTARARNLPKDDCQYCCVDYPDGLLLSTQENQAFLTLNGIQTLSAHYCNLLFALHEFEQLGVEVLRISPQSHHTEKVIDIFHHCLTKQIDLSDGIKKLQRLTPTGNCNGYWHGQAGLKCLPDF